MANTSWSGNRRSFPTAVRKQIMDRDNWQCQIKGPTCLGKATEADHRINHAEGGTDDASNGQAVCTACHDAKTKQERQRGLAKRSRYRGAMRHPGMR
jgi:5-methylcytosine-specific restriction protein A